MIECFCFICFTGTSRFSCINRTPLNIIVGILPLLRVNYETLRTTSETLRLLQTDSNHTLIGFSSVCSLLFSIFDQGENMSIRMSGSSCL